MMRGVMQLYFQFLEKTGLKGIINKMCGILGGVDYQTNDEVIRWMKSSLPLMADRGPDSSGYKIFNNLILGATRLRIFDNTELADQPYQTKQKT